MEVKLFENCVQRDSSFCDAYFRLVQSLVELGQWQRATNVLHKAKQRFPKEPLVNLGLGQSYLQMSEFDNAQIYFEKFLTLMPTESEGYLGLGYSLYRKGKKAEALFRIREAYKRGVLDLNYIQMFEAVLLYELKEFNKSMEVLKQINIENKKTVFNTWVLGIDLDTNLYGPVHYYLGLCNYACGANHFEAAKWHLKLAKKQGVNIDTVIAKRLGIYVQPDDLKNQLLNLYNHEKLVKSNSKCCLSMAVEKNRDDLTEVYKNVSWIIRSAVYNNQTDSFMRSLEILKVGVKKFPRSSKLKIMLERQYILMDSLNQGLKLCFVHDARNKMPTKTVLKGALILKLLHRDSEAIELLSKVEKTYKDRQEIVPPELLVLKGELYFLQDEQYLASEYFKNAQLYYSKDIYFNYYYALCLGLQGKISEGREYLYNSIKQGAIIPKELASKYHLII